VAPIIVEWVALHPKKQKERKKKLMYLDVN
jgi:hypothetical protein